MLKHSIINLLLNVGMNYFFFGVLAFLAIVGILYIAFHSKKGIKRKFKATIEFEEE